MEFLIELLFDIIVEGSIAIGSEKTVPMPLRIIAVIISLIVFFGMGGAFIYMGYESFFEQDQAACIGLSIAGVFLIVGGIFIVYKMFYKKKEKEN